MKIELQVDVRNAGDSYSRRVPLTVQGNEVIVLEVEGLVIQVSATQLRKCLTTLNSD